MSVSKKAVSLLAALVLALSLALVGCGGGGSGAPAGDSGAASGELTTLTPGILTVGSDCDYPPFIYMENGVPAGFEYDMMQAIGQDLGLTVEYLPPQNFDTLIASVGGGGTMDIGCSSFTITDERKELVDFSDSYYDANQACVVLGSSTIAGTADLAGLTVGAQSGTTGEAWALENIPGVTVKGFNMTSEALAALRAGEIEAVFFDEPVAIAQVNGAYNDCKIAETIPTGEQYGIAVPKDNPALLAAINASLANLRSSGRYDELVALHFS